MSEFVKVASVDEIPSGQAKLVEVQGNEIAIFNLAGHYHAIDNSCTHVGGSLCEGEINGNQVTCPWHGARFDITTGQVLGPPAFESVTRYKIQVDGDDIKIQI